MGARRTGVNNGLVLPSVCPTPLGKAITSPLPSPAKKLRTPDRRAPGRGRSNTSWFSEELKVSKLKWSTTRELRSVGRWMSSSRSSDTSADGVGFEEDNVKRILP